MLRRVIQDCYKYHHSDFLIDFSRQLMTLKAKGGDKIVIVDNGDGTRSMKNIVINKLLVTFKAENQVRWLKLILILLLLDLVSGDSNKLGCFALKSALVH